MLWHRTTARPTFGDALNDFLDRRAVPVQPLDFPHVIHVNKKIACTDNCHESALTGPVAGLPSVRVCMGCHNTVATDKPRIQRITQALMRRRKGNSQSTPTRIAYVSDRSVAAQ